jgi:hypothetical protein
LELAVPPWPMSGRAIADLERKMTGSLTAVEDHARLLGTQVIGIGILPTLREDHIGETSLSPEPRYRLLNDQILIARGEDMRIDIDGREHIRTHAGTIMAEAACTSVQFHAQVSPDRFAAHWNAAQAIAGVQVALGANSPFLFGRRLWDETRITLFEQATDTRPVELQVQGVRPRVWFGERWITSVFDLFEENVRYFPALLPLCDEEDPEDALREGKVPALGELTLHNGTVYRWNRPVYAVDDGNPHLRVENRVLPAGPTVVDILANAAFYYGLTWRLAADERPLWSRMSFATAAENLDNGARLGLDARMFWPDAGDVPVTELVLRRLLPLAADGLEVCGMESGQRDRLLNIIEQRCLLGRNGATWQSDTVAALEPAHGRHEALRLMTQLYIRHMRTNEPVHTWPTGGRP